MRVCSLSPLPLLALLAGACAPAAPPAPPPAAASPGAPTSAETSQPAAVAPAPTEPAGPTCEPLEVTLPEVPMGPKDPEIPDVVDPDRLAPFFEKAARVLRGKADDHVRIAVYGDSNLTMDFQTGQMRRTLQQAYGDAGHGFVALARPWSHYKHMDVRHRMKDGWQAYACSTDPVPDRLYGISGIAAESLSMGSSTWVETADPEASPIGHSASRFNVYYLKGPRRGTFEIRVDGASFKKVNAHADEVGLGVESFEVDDAPHKVEAVVADPDHRSRLLGVTLERGTPSFVVDSFGVGSMNTESQWKQDPALNHAMLQHRGYDLVIFATGANDGFTLDVTPKCLDDLIARHRKALPDAPIMFVTPSDRGKDPRTGHRLKKILAQRYEIAKKNGAALWDLWKAMGGDGSMKTFYDRGMAINDYTHFNEKGGTYMGLRLTYALWRELKRYVEAHPDAGCAEPDAAVAQN